MAQPNFQPGLQALVFGLLLGLCAACDQSRQATIEPSAEAAANAQSTGAQKVSATEPVTKIKNAATASSPRLGEPRDFDPAGAETLGQSLPGTGVTLQEHVEPVTLRDINGEAYRLANAWQQKPALIIFYRGGWCPYCNAQIRELSQQYEKLENAKLQPVLISVDKPDNAALVAAEYDIPFPVLSDPDLLAHKAFNVTLEIDAETVEKYRGFGIELEQWSGKDHNVIAMASAFIIDVFGHVRFSHVHPDYKARPSVDQLVGVAEQLDMPTMREFSQRKAREYQQDQQQPGEASQP